MREVVRWLTLVPVIYLAGSGPVFGATCESLLAVKLTNVTVNQSELVPVGKFVLPDGADGRGQDISQIPKLPAFCRVVATLAPSTDSSIAMELWLPATGWNGKFLAVGNGGWAGTISYGPLGRSLIDGVMRGYATASTDTGHRDSSPGDGRGDAHFAIGHPEKLIDLGYRAVHEMTVASKAIIAEFYGMPTRLSYWNGCSTGGRQGLMSAQRYPADFDGIVAGAPANNWTNMHAWDLYASVPALTDRSGLVPAAKLTMLNRSVLAACDAKDGVSDGFLNNPRACRFDPGVLACGGADREDCLTNAQLATVRRMYSPAVVSGQEIYPGKELGSEATWTPVATTAQQPVTVALGSFQVAYGNPDWDWRTFNLDRDWKTMDQRLGPVLNATDPDLSAFRARGGKLLLYHGWNDTLIPPGNTVNYFASVEKKMGPAENWMRLFMAPGMNHCTGGVGPDVADWVGALEQWREFNSPPQRIVATHVNQDGSRMTRPLCSYPQVAVYSGTGSTNDAANFVCKSN
jgi:feruloyl esterase